MDARTYIKISVGSLGLRIPGSVSAEPLSGTLTYSCEIRLHSFAVQTALVPFLRDDKINVEENSGIRSNSSANGSNRSTNEIAASFYLDESDLQRLLKIPSCKSSSRRPCLEILVLTGPQGALCGLNARRQIGNVKISVSPEWAEGRPLEIHHDWTSIGKKSDGSGRPNFELHAIVKVEPDPRFVFQFDGEPALSSQIIQSKGSVRQPVFSCKFSCDGSSRNGYVGGFNGRTASSNRERGKEGRQERKGWLVMIHDLSGSPVAAASMVTPFVPSSGSKYVSRSNPGAWLILRPEPDGILRSEPGGVSSWCPWGRLEAWREQGVKGGLGCRLQLVPNGRGMNGVHNGILVSETVICVRKGGDFVIDGAKILSTFSFPVVDSLCGSGDFNFTMALSSMNGFVMSCSIQGRGRHNRKRGRPVVQLAARHVSCVEDVAVFMALAAAVDLSMDACQPFTRKVGNELFDALS